MPNFQTMFHMKMSSLSTLSSFRIYVGGGKIMSLPANFSSRVQLAPIALQWRLVTLKIPEAWIQCPPIIVLPHPSDLASETLTFGRPSCKICLLSGKGVFPSDLCPNDFFNGKLCLSPDLQPSRRCCAQYSRYFQ